MSQQILNFLPNINVIWVFFFFKHSLFGIIVGFLFFYVQKLKVAYSIFIVGDILTSNFKH